jgi:hypothetical protein
MATSSSSEGFTFGMEMELFLKPKMNRVSAQLAKHKWTNRQTNGDELTQLQKNTNQAALQNTVADMLIEAGIGAFGPDEADLNAAQPYLKWQVTYDASLGRPAAGYCQHHHLPTLMSIANRTQMGWS